MTTEHNPAPFFDLIYVNYGEGNRTMSCAIWDGPETELIGPFPAKESGPAIVDALMARPSFGFATRKDAETAYTIRHFQNMSRGENASGQAYPMKLNQ